MAAAECPDPDAARARAALRPAGEIGRFFLGLGRLERGRRLGGAYRVEAASRDRLEGPALLAVVGDSLLGGSLGRQDLEVVVQGLGEGACLRPRQGRERRRARAVRAFRPEPPAQPLARRVDDVNLPHAAPELPDRPDPRFRQRPASLRVMWKHAARMAPDGSGGGSFDGDRVIRPIPVWKDELCF